MTLEGATAISNDVLAFRKITEFNIKINTSFIFTLLLMEKLDKLDCSKLIKY